MLTAIIVAALECQFHEMRLSQQVGQQSLRITRTQDIGWFYDVAGHRALLVGDEGAWFEVWVYPLKVFRDCEVGFVTRDGVLWGKDAAVEFTVTPEASTIVYQINETRVSQTIFAPVDEPGVVMLSECDEPVEVVIKLREDLRLMWPASEMESNRECEVDSETGAWAVWSREFGHAALAGWASGSSCSELEDGLTVAFEVSAGETGVFVVAASLEGLDDARKVWLGLARDAYRHLEETAEYYRRLDEETLCVELPDKVIEEAFRWAKIGLDKCYKASPGTGAGYVAGFNGSHGGYRPGFGWYFGRDSSWCQFAAAAYGQFDKARENTELLARYQIGDGPDKGKVYHEISAAHGLLPEESWQRGYAYFAADATPFFVIDMADYLRWTGNLEFVRGHWSHVLDAMEWCYRMDVDGDLLIDNPPAGHEWYDGGEKNMVDLVAIWCRALECAAEMGGLLECPSTAKWRKDAAKVRKILNTDFWDEQRGYIYDRKLPDGTMNKITTANPTVPLLWNLIEPEKAARAVDRLTRPDMTVPWGLRTNSNLDDIYHSQGYHAGTVWPLVTGWGALAAFNNNRPEAGLRYLRANAELTPDFCSGYITEVLEGDTRRPIGCHHQGWSEAMVVLPVVEGLLGIRVDAVQKKITFTPRIPADWQEVGVRNLRVGGSCFDISYRREGDGARVVVERTAGVEEYEVVVASW